MIIQLPKTFQLAAERQASKFGCESTEEYVAELVQRGLEEFEPLLTLRHDIVEATGLHPDAVTDEQIERYRKRIETLLLESLKDEPITTTVDDFIADIRRGLEQRRASRKSS